MRYQKLIVLMCILLIATPAAVSSAEKTEEENRQTPQPVRKLMLDQAVMCEDIKEYAPHNAAIVFSSAIGKVCCFTAFDPVPEKTYVLHKWFHKDKLTSQKKLTLKPPRWSTFSSIQLREADKGPWRVEVVDPEGKAFRILRFSILD
jgi:hypothetical protein